MTRISADWLTQPASRTVCAMLTDAGHQAYFVGGCVRNALLGAPVSDLDISTDARPDRVMALADAAGIKAVPTGIDHGTVTLVVDDIPFEVTTFRRDVATDGRRATVAFADDIADDARRRDFTMNALYAAPDGTLSDPLGGLPDLQARRVRFIDDAAQRIREDYLRILRFFRFHAWYGDVALGLDAEGLAACAMNLDGIAGLSRERITAEMLKLLAAPDPAPSVAAMGQSGVLAQVLPGADAGPLAVLVHLEEGAGIAPDAIRRLAVLGGQRERLRLSKDQLRQLDEITADLPLAELAYRHGVGAGRDRVLLLAASLGQPVSAQDLQAVDHAAKQVFPLKATDLMPRLSGAALGKALKAAEARWIASGFTLSKDDLVE